VFSAKKSLECGHVASPASAVLSWDDLPGDIQARVFGYLCLKELHTAALVCKRWHSEYRSRVDSFGSEFVRADDLPTLPQAMREGLLQCWDEMCHYLAQHKNATFQCWVDEVGQMWPYRPPAQLLFEVKGHLKWGSDSSSPLSMAHWCMHVYLHYKWVRDNGKACLQTRCDVMRGLPGQRQWRHMVHADGAWAFDSLRALKLLFLLKPAIIKGTSMLLTTHNANVGAPACLRICVIEVRDFRRTDFLYLLRTVLWDMGGHWWVFERFRPWSLHASCRHFKYLVKYGHYGRAWVFVQSCWALLQVPRVHGNEPFRVGWPLWY
jgi:hypothetical protein